jgi:hypothetical protein
MPVTRQRRAFAIVLAFGAILPSLVGAQTTTTPPSPVERFGFGAAGSLGPAGGIGAVRVSLPANDRFGLDLSVGRVDGGGTAVRSREA